MTLADAVFAALRASMSEPGSSYIDFSWHPEWADDEMGAEAARALAEDLASRMDLGLALEAHVEASSSWTDEQDHSCGAYCEEDIASRMVASMVANDPPTG